MAPLSEFTSGLRVILNTVVFTIGLCTIIFFLIIIFVTRSIVKPIGKVVRVLGNLAKGDLRQKIAVRSSDEIGELTNYLNHLWYHL